MRFQAIQRPSLERALTQAFDGGTRLIVIEAPAGYGKTTVLTQWARHIQGSNDNSGAHANLRWLGARGTLDPTWLWDQIKQQTAGESATVIIDDYGWITSLETDQELLRVLETNPRLRIILLTRKATALTSPLATSRVKVMSLRTADLEFTDAEINALEQKLIAGPRHKSEVVTAAVGRWPLGVHAMLLAAQRGTAHDRFAAGLAEGLLQATPDLLGAQILVAAARVPYVAVQSLAETLGLPQSEVRSYQRLLQELGALLPTESERQDLGTPPPSTIPYFIAQAKQLWSEEKLDDLLELTARRNEAENPGHAFRVLVRQGRLAQAAEILQRNFMTILDEGADTTSVLRAVPLDLFDDHPEMLMARVILERTDDAHPIEAVEELAGRLRVSVRNAMAAATEERMLLLQIYLVATERMLGNWDEALRLGLDFMARAADPHLRPTKQASGALATMYSVVALTACLVGDEKLTREAAARGLADARSAGDPIEVAHNLGLLASADILAGDLGEAAHHIAQMDDVMASNGVELREFSWVDGEVARAALLTHTGDLVGARATLDRLSPYVDRMEQWPLVVLTEADYASSANNDVAGLAALENRIRHKPQFRQVSDYWRSRVLEWEANANIFAGRLERATELISRMDPELPQTQTTALRVDLLRKDFAQVVQKVANLEVEHMELVPRLRFLMYGAVAASRIGDAELALTWWVSFAEYIEVTPQWFFTLVPFDWLTQSLLQVGESTVGGEDALPHELRALRERLHATPTSQRMLQFEQLSPSEQDVLRELATGASVAAIADNLFLSANTVKFHLRSLYRKLHVSDREGAVRRGVQIAVL